MTRQSSAHAHSVAPIQISAAAVPCARGEQASAAGQTRAARRFEYGDLVALSQPVRDQAAGDSDRVVRVLVAHGVKLVRAALAELLGEAGDIEVVAEAASGRAAVALAGERRPDVALMNVCLPGLDGLEATSRITSDPELSGVEVLILSEDERDDVLFGALRSGASGFLTGDSDPAELRRVVRILAGGGAQFSPSVTRRLIDEVASGTNLRRSVSRLFEKLTAREREVVTLVASGLTNCEIAQRLVVSPATAKTHVSHAMLKVHARDRAQLVAVAHQTGFADHSG